MPETLAKGKDVSNWWWIWWPADSSRQTVGSEDGTPVELWKMDGGILAIMSQTRHSHLISYCKLSECASYKAQECDVHGNR